MSDEEYGAQLLRPLRGEPGGASLIDVPKAMRDGRRMRNRRWLLGGGLLATVTAALVTGSLLISPAQHDKPVLPPDPPLPKACTLANLPLGKYKSAEVAGGDSTGRWQFGLSNPVVNTGPQRLLIWHDGRLTGEAKLPGIELTMADVNSSGVVVGDGHHRTGDTSNFRPYVYRDGKISLLKGGLGRAVAINDDGVIVGQIVDGDREVAVRWRAPDAAPEPLPMPPKGAWSNATTIAPDGTIAGYVGYLGPGAKDTEATGREVGNGYLWRPDGTVRMLEAPPTADDPLSTVSPIVFRFGWLYADQNVAIGTDHDIHASAARLYRYDPGSDTWQKLTDDRGFVQIPGPGRGSQYEGLSSVPRVYVGARILDLPMSAPVTDPDIDSALVAAISDDAHVLPGWAVSGDTDPKQPFRPIIWRCR
jgi:hypothetical protein